VGSYGLEQAGLNKGMIAWSDKKVSSKALNLYKNEKKRTTMADIFVKQS
jgi:hypothetical protein